MANMVKRVIQNTLVDIAVAEYNREVKTQKKYNSYYGWIVYQNREKEKLLKGFCEPVSVKQVCFSSCNKSFSLENINTDIVIFYGENGKLDEDINALFAKYFYDHPDVNVCYADEDSYYEKDGKNIRIAPWVKPCWSENTLLSFQYFGNVFAIRRKTLATISWIGSDDYMKNIYALILKSTCTGKVGKIEMFLFSKKLTDVSEINELPDGKMQGIGEDYNEIKNAGIAARGHHGKMVLDERTGFSHAVYDCIGNPKVSIIIPSKDNPKVLLQCISSVRKLTTYENYEIIVVDNGSNDENRKVLEEEKNNLQFSYYYEPMDFNFSRMCNLGVEKSSGDYILLLNDDMEVLEGSWLSRMLGQAMLPNTGAVGAKLLYPNTTLIQHAGVVNSSDGPTHKLGRLDDSECYYYGKNKLVYDMIGVTAACLLVDKKKFLEVDGLFEGLKVAFNDVDLCFKLYEKGYNNVQRNDVVLYHHESLSRGNDLVDEKKIERLLGERDVLYSRHIALKKKDPYMGALYNGGYPEIRQTSAHDRIFYNDALPKLSKPLPEESTMNKMVFPTVDKCGLEEDEDYYVIKGYTYLPGLDNARFKRKVLLRDKAGKVYECKVHRLYRKDVADGLKDIENPELSGFCIHIKKGLLPAGEYELWLYAKDFCSRQCMYRNTKEILTVE